MKILYIGGTGEISYPCVHASAALGHQVTVYNRGKNLEPLPTGVRRIAGELDDRATYGQLGKENFDVVCQFLAYSPDKIDRDLEVFGGHTGQYVFISTASGYEKPPKTYRITEDVPMMNPYWGYSSTKAKMEQMLFEAHAANRMAVTIIRPSHTYRREFPGTFIGGNEHAWRMMNNKPIIMHGDGTSPWTLTHSDDFAVPFAKLLGDKRALGEAFHIMTDTVFTWDELWMAVGRAIGVETKIVHVPTDTLIRYNKDWTGPLLGDKSWSTLFDTSKVEKITGTMPRATPLEAGLARVATVFRERMKTYQPNKELNALLDRIIGEQSRLGA